MGGHGGDSHGMSWKQFKEKMKGVDLTVYFCPMPDTLAFFMLAVVRIHNGSSRRSLVMKYDASSRLTHSTRPSCTDFYDNSGLGDAHHLHDHEPEDGRRVACRTPRDARLWHQRV